MEMQIDGGGSCLRIPQPSAACRALGKTVVLRLPEALPHRKIVVVTRKKTARASQTSLACSNLHVKRHSDSMVNTR